MGFGLGRSPWAPGTVGSLPGVLAVALLWPALPSPWVQTAFALLCAAVAIPICDAGEKHLGVKDPHPVVADEYLCFPLCMIGLPASPLALAIAFVSARFFDIVKPPPARRLQRLPGGLGIVIDDVFASLYSLAANHLVWWALTR